jgi:hypothetical protein
LFNGSYKAKTGNADVEQILNILRELENKFDIFQQKQIEIEEKLSFILDRIEK